ncbi:MAG: single-stranded-DNA-specific exonuclease RecJ [Candidatus Pacebacteria bacterium]|nr:single-stranded-DNA-specific exonuclease RecJ [Candidatus Paceibacterota bacterium]
MIAQNLSKYPLLAQTLLKNRGILTSEDAEKFLNPDYERDIYDPFLILNMEKAVERIIHAMDFGEKIVIFGDYDCDGIPGSVILHDFFKKIGYKNFEVYIPHRHNEGYGLNIEAVESIAKSGARLMMTVDCGISDVKEVARAQELGVDVIVTDHHLAQEILPPAFTILNSKQAGDKYPDNMLCGAGVAWKLVCALLSRGREKWKVAEGWEKWLLDMAGLSTIADMVPLKNENRVLAYYGLAVLRKTRRIGLLNLLRKMDIDQRNLIEDDIGFMVGPRINAASRMGDPMDAFRLLSTTDDKEGNELAEHLTHLNDTRKGLVASMAKDAHKHIDLRISSETLREIIVIGNPEWKPGLAGLLASKIVETYGKTTFVWGRAEDGSIKGSCRSDGTVNLVELMTGVRSGIFLDIGGHSEAGGFSVSSDGIHKLEDELVLVYKKLCYEKKEVSQDVDANLLLSEINLSTWKIIEKFAPFGAGNPKPVFLFEKISVSQVRKFGKEKSHIELAFENSPVKAICFFADDAVYKTLKSGSVIDLVATVEKNLFRGKNELRLRIVNVVKK